MIDRDRLRSIMADRGISQSELGRRVGVSQATIYKLLTGESYGSKYIHRIARELGTTSAYLTAETDDPDAESAPLAELSRDEVLWVEIWRALPHERRAAVVEVVQYAVGDKAAVTIHAPRTRYEAEQRA